MTLLKVAALAACALTLTACSTLQGDPTSNLPSQVLDNLRHCKRTYQASLGGIGIPGGQLYIECPAQPYDAPAEPSE
jgi:hypothetical protein